MADNPYGYPEKSAVASSDQIGPTDTAASAAWRDRQEHYAAMKAQNTFQDRQEYVEAQRQAAAQYTPQDGEK